MNDDMYMINESGELLHYGVKGMKWGIRRYQPYQKGDGQKGKGKFLGKDSTLGKHIRSKKREASMVAQAKNKKGLSKLSGDQVRSRAQRMQNENKLKEYSKTRKQKREYLDRHKLSDKELQQRVERLNFEHIMDVEANKTLKPYIDTGKKLVSSAATYGIDKAAGKSTEEAIKNAMNSYMSGRTPNVGPKDILNIIEKRNLK